MSHSPTARRFGYMAALSPMSECEGFIWMARCLTSIRFYIRTLSPSSCVLAWRTTGVSQLLSGTAAGEDHFHALKLKAEDDPDWDDFRHSGHLARATARSNPDEVEEMRNDMSPDEFAREMLCSFQAPVEGAYYQEAINALAVTEPGHQGCRRFEHQRDHGVGFGHPAFASASGCFRFAGGSCTGSTISRARASRSVTMSTFSRSRPRLAVSATAHTCCHTM